ncbi:L-type lectin-domain containing receptor kinase IV.1 [Acorus gramineus]|uniref:non-specific serine/threonine protein kinase n=1 Tax=Acorus gramineus TaxID=55184 RepID=A0AAV9BFK3_ACOGR|nr:L-type lectin-domain containing receptor kinase IV.1 [Acorus gramineus]
MLNTLVCFLLLLFETKASISDESFIFNGFRGANMTLNGLAEITSNGLLRLTNTTQQQQGHAFHPTLLHFNKSFSFSTTFVFAIISEYPKLSAHGFTFVLSPNTDLPGSLPGPYLGLFNQSNNGNSSNHVFAVELDTILSPEFGDINDNHVGIDVNGLRSVEAHTAGYFSDGSNIGFHNLSLISGRPMQLWVDYDGLNTQLNVTLSPIRVLKPDVPLMSITIDLSDSTLDSMYAGFSSSTGSVLNSHYILGWSFCINGKAQDLDLSRLPSLPRIGPKEKPKVLTIGLPVILSVVALTAASIIGVTLWRRHKFAELMEDWEHEYGPHRFSYKELYMATRGFREQELLGAGGFGRVYKGVLPKNKCEVAIKRVSHESRQGMREFVAEIISIGRLRHRNIVQLLGYCRRKGELLLVYDYMSNGSLNKLLFDGTKRDGLGWSERFCIVRGVASGLLYLHEGWEQLVIHRDIKSSNVLLDGEMNARLGDFGLARLYDHGTDPLTTHIVGTLGYLAPELSKTGKEYLSYTNFMTEGTTSTDVFSFGAFLLEVVCGRRPIDLRVEEPMNLVDWVLDHWWRGTMMETVDERLGSEYAAEEVELVLKLGLLCTHIVPSARPSMKQVMQFLDRDIELPNLSPDYMNVGIPNMEGYHGFDDFFMAYGTSSDQASLHSSTVEASLLSGGR